MKRLFQYFLAAAFALEGSIAILKILGVSFPLQSASSICWLAMLTAIGSVCCLETLRYVFRA